MYKQRIIGVVVPVYNEEKLISDTLKHIPDVVDRIYIINDGSTDASGEILNSIVSKRICIMHNQHNMGPGAATIKGYKKALEEDMDIIVKMDGDDQMDSKYFFDLISPIINDQADYTKGNRLSRYSHRNGMSNWRFFGNWVLTILTRVSSGYWRMSDSQNGYTAISSEGLKKIDMGKVHPYYGYLNDILVQLNITGCRIQDVPMPAKYGIEQSKIKYSKYITCVALLLLRGFILRLKAKYFS